jgi:hypothetical protein
MCAFAEGCCAIQHPLSKLRMYLGARGGIFGRRVGGHGVHRKQCDRAVVFGALKVWRTNFSLEKSLKASIRFLEGVLMYSDTS